MPEPPPSASAGNLRGNAGRGAGKAKAGEKSGAQPEQTPAKDQFLNELATRYGPALERFLARKLENPADAADAAQEALLRMHRLQQPERLDNARAFLFQVASNLAVDQLRRRSLHYRALNTGAAAPPSGADAAAPEEVLAAREKLARLFSAVEALPEKCRQAFLLHRRSGMSYTEIAAELGVSVSSVEKYILQALKHCRKTLAVYDSEGDASAADAPEAGLDAEPLPPGAAGAAGDSRQREHQGVREYGEK